LFVPFSVVASNPAAIDGNMGSAESWTQWFSDQTYEYHGFPCHQQTANTLAYEVFSFSDNSNLYLFVLTNDNTADSSNRDKFMVYFDIYPYGLGSEDTAFCIEPPTDVYGPGLKLHGPTWSDFISYSGIASGSNNGRRTFEVAVPLVELVPNRNDVNYRNAKVMIYLENRGPYVKGAHKVINYFPDAACGNKYWKESKLWQQIDLSALCSDFFNPTPQQYTLTVDTFGGGAVACTPSGSSYVSGTIVQLTALPDAGWQFAAWGGDLAGSANPTTAIMNQDKAVAATFTQIPYSLTVTSLAEGCSITVNPNQTSYHYGDSVCLTAVATGGWFFSGWGGSLSGSANPATLTFDENEVVFASFAQNEYTLEVNTAGSGSGRVDRSISGPCHHNDVVQITAVPNEGSSFLGWGGDLSGIDNPASITINGDMAVTATFTKKQCSLDIDVEGSGFVAIYPRGSTFPYGTEVQLIATPLAGWTFGGWSGDLAGPNNPATIILAGNKQVFAVFAQDNYQVVLNTFGQGGNPTITPLLPSYTYGAQVTLEAHPLPGWTFSTWSSNTPNIVLATPSQESSIAIINGEGTVTATYTQNTYTLTTNVIPSQGGSVTLDILGPYHYGDVVTLTAIASTGYSFSGWSGDGEGVSVTCAVTINSDKTVDADFAINWFTDHVSVEPTIGGSVTSNKTATNIRYGDVIAYTAIPEPGYTFSEWSGDAFGTAETVCVTVTGPIQLTAVFLQVQYDLSVTVIGSECSVARSVYGPYHYGDTVTLTANSAVGWSFSGWNGDTTSTANPVTMIITGNLVLSAAFTQDQYEIEVNSPFGSVTLSPNQPTYAYGTQVRITANANPGYRIQGFLWEQEGSPIRASSGSVLDLIINGDTRIFVNAERLLCSLAVITVGNGTGSVTLNPYSRGGFGNNYFLGDEVELRAAPDLDCTFVGWGEDVSGINNPITVIITGDTTVTACFLATRLVKLHLTPEVIAGPEPDIGDLFEVALEVENVSNLWVWGDAKITWNPSVLQMIGVSEGGFLRSVGNTLFITGAIDNIGGTIGPLAGVMTTRSTANGTGVLAVFTFKVIGYGESEIGIGGARLVGPEIVGHPEIAYSIAGATFSLSPPPAVGPVARFALPNRGNCYVGDLLVLDGSGSFPGYDNLPLGHETTNEIIEYKWSIDVGFDGTLDTVLYGELVSTDVLYVGQTSITLTVTAPDTYAPSSLDYVQENSVTHLLDVRERPTRASIDVYTERGGQLSGESSDAFGPQESVTIYALVTYNDAPVVGKDVVFEIRDTFENVIAIRVARTNDDGVATVEFRLPWPTGDPESLMGIWTIVGNVDISEFTASDLCTFQFGYLIAIDSITLFGSNGLPASSFSRNGGVSAVVSIHNIRGCDVPVALTLTINDVANVPIEVGEYDITVPSQGTFSLEADLNVPARAFIGYGVVYGDVYTAIPSKGGTPYCPEKSCSIHIRP
jgi:hypothetical protein